MIYAVSAYAIVIVALVAYWLSLHERRRRLVAAARGGDRIEPRHPVKALSVLVLVLASAAAALGRTELAEGRAPNAALLGTASGAVAASLWLAHRVYRGRAGLRGD